MSEITGFHAHVYFDADSLERAETLCRRAARELPVRMGRVHRKPVGPHPRWSCRLALAPEHFGQVVPWLLTHRDGLTVFVHAETGDDLLDHTEHAMWMGSPERLDLSRLRQKA